MEFVELFSGDRARQFDATIRARIPAYDAVLQVAACELACRCPEGSILSVGCGSGGDVVDLARHPGYRVTAIDPSPDMVALAAARFEAEGLLAEIARRLRPGAELVLLDFCRTEAHARDLSALRVYLDWFSGLPATDRNAYLKRVSEVLHLLPADAYPERARRAGFTGARPFYSNLHVGGWILTRG